jgi:hypothetical protein
MRFKLDENLPRAAREPLSENGWDVHDVEPTRLRIRDHPSGA